MAKPVLESVRVRDVFDEIDANDYRANNLVTRRKKTLWVGPDKVSVTSSTLNQGTNKHSGKTYARWQTETATGYYRAKSGVIIPYRYARIKDANGHWTMRNDRFSENWLRGPLKTDIDYAVKRVFGIEQTLDLYPIAKHLGITYYGNIFTTLRAAERNDNMRDFVAAVFGKSNLRRDLIKAVALSDQSSIEYAMMFRHLVPVDWIVTFLRENERVVAPYTQGVGGEWFRSLLTQLNPKSYKHLLKQQYDARDGMMIFNLNRQRDFIEIDGDEVYKSVRDIHDLIVRNHARYQAQPAPDVPIALVPVAKKIDGLLAGKFTIVPAKTTNDMVEWAKAMSNCIAGYRMSAVKGNGVYAGVYVDGALKANLEIKGGQLTQLLGRFNQSLSQPDREVLEKALSSAGIGVSSYWGKA